MLNTLNLEIVKRTRPTSVFNFAEASIGNLFLTGYVVPYPDLSISPLHADALPFSRARLFAGSFESAIYLLYMICSIPDSVSVLPAINSNFTHHISAGLANGTQITGQVAISHPSGPTAVPDDGVVAPDPSEEPDHDRIEDANLPGSLPALRRQHIAFSKADSDNDDLPARVERVWYINPYGHEIWPVANPKVLAAVAASATVIYSIGSLYTSIVPSVILRGVGAAIAASGVRHRVLILNGRIDRETGPGGDEMTARDFVAAIVRAGGESWAPEDEWRGEEMLRRYVSHLVYLEGEGTPVVDVDELTRLGIVCVKVKGRMGKQGELRYDEGELGPALEGIVDS